MIIAVKNKICREYKNLYSFFEVNFSELRRCLFSKLIDLGRWQINHLRRKYKDDA